VRLEFQVLRDMKAFSRAQFWTFADDEPPCWISLGALENPTNEVVVTVSQLTDFYPNWKAYRLGLLINRSPVSTSVDRPGVVFCQPTDIPSGLVEFPPRAIAEGLLNGFFTVTVRCVEA